MRNSRVPLGTNDRNAQSSLGDSLNFFQLSPAINCRALELIHLSNGPIYLVKRSREAGARCIAGGEPSCLRQRGEPPVADHRLGSPERVKDAGNFRLSRPYQGSCYCGCPTPGCARSYLSSGLPGRRQIYKLQSPAMNCRADLIASLSGLAIDI